MSDSVQAFFLLVSCFVFIHYKQILHAKVLIFAAILFQFIQLFHFYICFLYQTFPIIFNVFITDQSFKKITLKGYCKLNMITTIILSIQHQLYSYHSCRPRDKHVLFHLCLVVKVIEISLIACHMARIQSFLQLVPACYLFY